MKTSRRDALLGILAAWISGCVKVVARPEQRREIPADLIVHNAKVTTLQSDRSEAQAFADRGEKFVAVGGEAQISDPHLEFPVRPVVGNLPAGESDAANVHNRRIRRIMSFSSR
jgi:hypothetical protein